MGLISGAEQSHFFRKNKVRGTIFSGLCDPNSTGGTARRNPTWAASFGRGTESLYIAKNPILYCIEWFCHSFSSQTPSKSLHAQKTSLIRFPHSASRKESAHSQTLGRFNLPRRAPRVSRSYEYPAGLDISTLSISPFTLAIERNFSDLNNTLKSMPLETSLDERPQTPERDDYSWVVEGATDLVHRRKIASGGYGEVHEVTP
jgi:hypothetical protein